MLRSIATVSVGGSLPDKLEAIAEAGFDGIELFENDLLDFDGTSQAVRHFLRTYGLKVFLSLAVAPGTD
jgi:4-hydroxyphenylpyruvate dioxygenase